MLDFQETNNIHLSIFKHVLPTWKVAHTVKFIEPGKNCLKDRLQWSEGDQVCKWKQGSLLNTIKLMELGNNMLGLTIML